MVRIEHPLYREDLSNTAALIERSGLSGKILIIGATGLIGSFLTDSLIFFNRSIRKQFEIYAMGRSLLRLQKRFSYALSDEIFFWEHDINEPLDTEIEFDYIFQLASNADPGAYAAYPVETITTNVLGCINVIQYAKGHLDAHVLFTSSMEVYGENDGRLLQEGDFGVINCNCIRSGYPESKRVSELLYRSAVQQYGIWGCIARLGYIYGPAMTNTDNKVAAQFLRAAVRGQDLVLESPGLQRRTYCYVADAVTGMVTAVTAGASGEAYNIADRNSLVTIRQMGEIIAEHCGVKMISAESMPGDNGQAGRQDAVLDAEKLEQLGWNARIGITEGLYRTLKMMDQEGNARDAWILR